MKKGYQLTLRKEFVEKYFPELNKKNSIANMVGQKTDAEKYLEEFDALLESKD